MPRGLIVKIKTGISGTEMLLSGRDIVSMISSFSAYGKADNLPDVRLINEIDISEGLAFELYVFLKGRYEKKQSCHKSA